MTKLQLLLFAWVAAWVLAETISPNIGYFGKLQASIIATFATALAHNMLGLMWSKLRDRKG